MKQEKLNEELEEVLMDSADSDRVIVDKVRKLVDNGADIVNFRDEYGDNALFVAIERDNAELVRLAIEKGVDIKKNEVINFVLFQSENLEIIDILLKAGANINGDGEQSEIPLSTALKGTNKEVIEYLINHGADVSLKNKYKNTPLHYAVAYSRGDSYFVESLLKLGVNANAINVSKRTPLDIANSMKAQGVNNIEEIIDLLKQHGAKTYKELTESK